VFAVVLWQALGPDEGRRLAVLLIWLSIGVAISVALQAAGLVSFSESVSGEGLSTPRYGGATGSFIHASIFLGTAIPILAGWLLAQRSRAGVVRGAIGLAVLLGGLALTFGRAGVGIAAIGLVLLFLASPWRTRLQILAVAAAALAIAIPASWAAGRSPSGLADRLAGVVDPDDPGNEARIRGQEHALNTFRDAPPSEKVLGNGLASTGNARKLASLGSASTESFVLKLLVETGLVGLIAIGAVLIWTAAVFLRLCFSSVPPLAKGVGAAGFGLFVDGFLFQTLEVQLIAMTWWLMLVIALRERRLSRP
jgi:O-antigen ligase